MFVIFNIVTTAYNVILDNLVILALVLDFLFLFLYFCPLSLAVLESFDKMSCEVFSIVLIIEHVKIPIQSSSTVFIRA